MAKKVEYVFQSNIRKQGKLMILNVPKRLHKKLVDELQEPLTVNVKITGLFPKQK
jgi:hypothetical protein